MKAWLLDLIRVAFAPDSPPGKFTANDAAGVVMTSVVSSGAAYAAALHYTQDPKGSIKDALIAGGLVLLSSAGHRFAGGYNGSHHAPPDGFDVPDSLPPRRTYDRT